MGVSTRFPVPRRRFGSRAYGRFFFRSWRQPDGEGGQDETDADDHHHLIGRQHGALVGNGIVDQGTGRFSLDAGFGQLEEVFAGPSVPAHPSA